MRKRFCCIYLYPLAIERSCLLLLEHSDRVLVSFSQVAGERLDSTGTIGNTNFGLVANKTHQFVSSRPGSSSSPSRIGLDRHIAAYMDEYVADTSTGRTLERESPHRAVDYGLAKALGREEELGEWQRKPFPSDGRKRFQTSATYSLSNGQPRQNPRALIDAYGSDKSQETSGSKPLLVERLDRNGMDKVLTTSWQNTEEEEFDWEDMSPTLVDHSRNNGFSSEKSVTVAANATSSFSRMVPGFKFNVDGRPPILPATFEMRPSINVHAARPPSLNPVVPLKNLVSNPFESINPNNTIVSHGPNRYLHMHEQSLHGVEKKDINKGNLHQLPNQPAGLISSNPQNSGQAPQVQFFPSQDPAASQFSYRGPLQGHGALMRGPFSNALPVMPLPLPGQRIGNNSLHLHGGALPPFPPPGPHASQMLPYPNPNPFVSSQRPPVPYSNLINSLMAQGVISLTSQAPTQVTKSIPSAILYSLFASIF